MVRLKIKENDNREEIISVIRYLNKNGREKYEVDQCRGNVN